MGRTLQDELLKRTLESTNETLNISNALKEAIAKNDMETVRKLNERMKERTKQIQARIRDGK